MTTSQPNILLIVLDQSRKFRWFPDHVDELIPGRAELAREGVSFDRFYANTAPCSPSRASMLTGLYAHQHWILSNCNRNSSLDTDFPTIASMLGTVGYRSRYFGKWHLTSAQRWPGGVKPSEALKPYGFDSWSPQPGPEVQDPVGGMHGGLRLDNAIADSAIDWLSSVADTGEPWFSVVSFVNPHDITNFPSPEISQHIAKLKAMGVMDDFITELPANYETLDQLSRNKPSIQHRFARGFSSRMKSMMGSSDPEIWVQYLNYYLFLESVVDDQVTRVIDALKSRPDVLANTVVVYTSDHGELAGSHGLKGKITTMYEEQMNVPLIITDNTGRFVPADTRGTSRDQLSSIIDLAPTLLALGGAAPTGGEFDYLPGNDLLPILRDSKTAGAEYLLATFDKPSRRMRGRESPPWHILGYRDERWKYNLYSQWGETDLLPLPAGEEQELYDLEQDKGRLELDNVAARATQTSELRERMLADLLPRLLRAPLPGALGEAQQRAEAAVRRQG